MLKPAPPLVKSVAFAAWLSSLMFLTLQGFEIGSGFAGSRLLGSEHNDEFYMAADGQIRTRTNR